MTTIYIYALKDPTTNEIRYVGKTNNPTNRYAGHLSDKNNRLHKTRWINTLKENGLLPVIEILECASRDNWKERERYWIKKCRSEGANLTNISIGGEGASQSVMTGIVNDTAKMLSKHTLFDALALAIEKRILYLITKSIKGKSNLSRKDKKIVVANALVSMLED